MHNSNNISLNILFPFKIILKNRHLLSQLVKRNIATRYKGSAFGILWSIIQPLTMLCVYTFVFSVVFKTRWGVDTEGSSGSFAIIMFCGMAMFNIFSESVNSSCGIIIANQNFVKKVIFPLEMLPLTQVLSSFILGMIWFLLLFLGIIFVFGNISFTMLLIPLVLIPLLMFTLGVSYFIASLGVYIRDIQYLIGVIIQILFFPTPIFYPLQAVPEKYRWALQINPLTILIEETRNLFIYGIFPNWSSLGISFLISIVVLYLGFFWFYKTQKGFSDVL